MIYSLIKRSFDFIIAFLLILVFSPVYLVIGLVNIFHTNGKPLFIQKRLGKNAKIFNLIKFRTMNEECDSSGKLLPAQDRLTPFGIFLRRTSLDELPQLWNVFKGDMSFVGPRPLLVKYLERYSPSQALRHNVKPGITGWAQINGRNKLTWEKKFEYDVWYVQNSSVLIDVKILFATIFKVLKKEGINSADENIMAEFMGNSLE